MGRYPWRRRVVEAPINVDGFKACPKCHSINLDHPGSKMAFDPSGLPYMSTTTAVDYFPGYSSWVCLDCSYAFEIPEFKPTDNLTPIEKGTLNAGW